MALEGVGHHGIIPTPYKYWHTIAYQYPEAVLAIRPGRP